MSKIKNFNPALYESHFAAIKHFIQEGRLMQYDFNVSSGVAAENALAYLCVNDIPHQFHTVQGDVLSLVTIVWIEEGQDYSYCFWCEGKI